jgi:hypothetical protein
MAQCIATSRRSGERCKRPALAGATVCSKHGGSAPQVKAAAARRVEQAKASAATARLGLRVEGDPIAHMLDVIAYQAGMVAYWRSVVEAIDDDSLTWGATKVNDGPTGTTEEAKPHIAYSLLDEAQSKLVRYCAEAMKAGVAERQVRLAEQQGSLMSALQRAVLSRMLDAVLGLLAEHGVTGAEVVSAMRDGWSASAAVVVPEEIRRLMATSDRGGAR